VIRGFIANQGFLLSGAVAYYTLLTIIPMFAVILVALSQFQEIQPLLDTLQDYLALITPNRAEALISQISGFLQNWKTVGITGILVLLFFSSFAFTSLENAMSVIFFHRVAIRRRNFLISAIIPYCYILALAVGMLILSFLSTGLHSLDAGSFMLMGKIWSLSGIEGLLIYLLGVAGEVMLLTSTYLVMPVGRLSLRHALIGGITAALLWELTRHFLVWYFASLSLVNIVYGAFASVIIILLTLEAAAIILLLGAQVIAEYERIDTTPGKSHGLKT
jgi:YihY family inner membrane protein